jgi:hypothetical protein
MSRYACKIRRPAETGAVYRFKARLILRGSEQEKGKKYDKKICSTPGIAIARIITSIAAANDLQLHSTDIREFMKLQSSFINSPT